MRNLNSNFAKRSGAIASFKKMVGLALVEVTLVLPFLFFLMMATAEVGRYLYSYNSLSQHGRNAVRFLSTRSFGGTIDIIDINDTQKIAQVKNFVVYGNANGSGAPLLANLTPAHVSVESSGVYVIVQINYPFTPLFGFGGDALLNLDISTRVSMRALD